MSLHCIGRRNVESIVWSAWGSVGAGVDKIRQNSPFFVYFGVRGQQNWTQEQTKFFCPSVRAAIAIVLPVTEDRHIRANLQNHRFARKPVWDIE